MIDRYTEIEVKLEADKIAEKEFMAWASSKGPHKYLCVEGYDYYYSQNDNVVRLRVPPDESPQLTVKKRKSQQSTRDRQEIDLTFSKETTSEDIKEFLVTSGFSPDVVLFKRALIFWYKNKLEEVDVSFYSVSSEKDGKRSTPKYYLEIEVLKGSEVSPETAKKYLKKWLDEINTYFKLDLKPLNLSLYEIFQQEESSVKK